jgi:hypothetical protein
MQKSEKDLLQQMLLKKSCLRLLILLKDKEAQIKNYQ